MSTVFQEGSGELSDEELENPIVSVSMGVLHNPNGTGVGEKFRVVVFFNGSEEFQPPTNLEQSLVIKHYNIMFGQMMKAFFEAYDDAKKAQTHAANSSSHPGH